MRPLIDMQRDIFNALKYMEMTTNNWYTLHNPDCLPKPLFEMTTNFEDSRDNLFNEYNWNCGSSDFLHTELSDTGAEIRKIGKVRLHSKWDNDDFIMYINYKLNGKRYAFKVVRYKNRGSIEKYVNLETGKYATFEDYVNMLVLSNYKGVQNHELEIF